jgi:tryptophanase
LVIGGITLLTDSITDGYKRIKLMEIKQKWMYRLSGLDGKELEYLVIGLRHKYPLLLGQFQNLLQAGKE